eukprot:scaffold18456_cov155-Skeletonema_menzelii.AAC.2
MNRTYNQSIQSLYKNDRSLWENEANARMIQSKDERIEQIRSRAYTLKAKREEERLQLVKDCYRRQWKESCDEMRVLQSKEMLNQIVKDRKLDILAICDTNDDSHLRDMCILRNDNEDCDQHSKHHESILQTRRALDKQIELKKKQAAAATAQLHREEQEQMLLKSKLEGEARESERLASEKAKQEQQEVLEDTLQRAKEKQSRQELEKHHDAILLEHALARERDAIRAEETNKLDSKEASKEFIRCLQEQTQHQEEENETVNKIRSQQMDRIAKKKENRMKAEEIERRRQQEQITLSRQQQILKKSREAEMKQREEQDFVEEAREAILRAVEAERRDKENAKLKRLETANANKEMAKERQEQERLHKEKIQQEERSRLQALERSYKFPPKSS